MLSIVHTSTYKGYTLNPTIKGNKGFYESHLKYILDLLTQSIYTYRKALAAHIIINNPSPKIYSYLGRELNRWYDLESSCITNNHPSYFSCIETRPRNKQKHLHLLVIFEKLEDNYFSLKKLEKRLTKFSKDNACKLIKRKASCIPLHMDSATGEIKTDENGKVMRRRSAYYHTVSVEFGDAFERFSYLAKVATKDNDQIEGIDYSRSRLRIKSSTLTTSTSHSSLGDNLSAKVDLNLGSIDFDQAPIASKILGKRTPIATYAQNAPERTRTNQETKIQLRQT